MILTSFHILLNMNEICKLVRLHVLSQKLKTNGLAHNYGNHIMDNVCFPVYEKQRSPNHWLIKDLMSKEESQ